MPPSDEAELVQWIRDEQENLWTDLEHDIRHAINGVWSMGAVWTAHRIVSAARLVGPTRWRGVPWEMLTGGVYEALLRAVDIEPDLPESEEVWARTEELMSRQGLRSRAEALPIYRRTVKEVTAMHFGDKEDS